MSSSGLHVGEIKIVMISIQKLKSGINYCTIKILSIKIFNFKNNTRLISIYILLSFLLKRKYKVNKSTVGMYVCTYI